MSLAKGISSVIYILIKLITAPLFLYLIYKILNKVDATTGMWVAFTAYVILSFIALPFAIVIGVSDAE